MTLRETMVTICEYDVALSIIAGTHTVDHPHFLLHYFEQAQLCTRPWKSVSTRE